MARSKRFEITENHLKLIKRMYVGWQNCETGAPEIDPKRPYGNSYVAGDVAEIIDMKPEGDEDQLSYEQQDKCLALHQETEQVLQIFLQQASLKPGTYYNKKDYGAEWEFESGG